MQELCRLLLLVIHLVVAIFITTPFPALEMSSGYWIALQTVTAILGYGPQILMESAVALVRHRSEFGSYSSKVNSPFSGVVCSQGSVRLSGGNSQQGRVEICINNNWGTVCDNSWSTVDANIVCQQLGYSNSGNHNMPAFSYKYFFFLYFCTDATARLNAYFGAGSGSILMNYVACSGSESRLIDCSYSTSTSGCSHNDDAGVQCQTSQFLFSKHLRDILSFKPTPIALKSISLYL